MSDFIKGVRRVLCGLGASQISLWSDRSNPCFSDIKIHNRLYIYKYTFFVVSDRLNSRIDVKLKWVLIQRIRWHCTIEWTERILLFYKNNPHFPPSSFSSPYKLSTSFVGLVWLVTWNSTRWLNVLHYFYFHRLRYWNYSKPKL